MVLGLMDRQHIMVRPWTALATTLLVIATLWMGHADSAMLPDHRLKTRDSFAGGVELRVLPIGDSITNGTHWSSDAGGYRSRLYALMKDQWSNTINFVGGEENGDFAENHHEGHSGDVIQAIEDKSQFGIYQAANIVLVHAGTNDIDHGTPSQAIPNLIHLINTIFEHSEDAAVFVCKVIPSKDSVDETGIERYNSDIDEQIPSHFSGESVVVVDMFKGFNINNLHDDLHPNDNGYQDMANRFMSAIKSHEDLIKKPGTAKDPPSGSDPHDSERCESYPQWGRGVEIAAGAKVAFSDGEFTQYWGPQIMVASGHCPRDEVHFMDLDGDGLKDYACVDPKTGAVTVLRSLPDALGEFNFTGHWGAPVKVVDPQTPRDGTSVLFADINGDGRDDYVYIDPRNGAISAWINRGMGPDVWQWESIGRIAGGFNATIDNTQMVDLDGDGRADLVHINPETGKVSAWNNGGGDSVPDYFSFGEIATGASFPSGDKLVMVDFTGNGRADYAYIGEDGTVNGFVNRLQEMVLQPRWHGPVLVAEGGEDAHLDNVRLVDLTGDGKADYLVVDKKTGSIRFQENRSVGGHYQEGEGVIFADLDGDGAMDYLWVDPKGTAYGYLNKGKGTNNWDNVGKIATGLTIRREYVRMAVLTDSKRADYVLIDEATGRANWYRNTGGKGGDSGDWFKYEGVIASGPAATLKNNYDLEFDISRVQFADLNHDGLDDYLYVTDTGAVIMWAHLTSGKNEWGLPHKVADGPKMDPDGDGVAKHVQGGQVRFADTDGDGKNDYVIVGSVTGRSYSWHNLGVRKDGSISWNTPLPFADGPGAGRRGSGVQIADMTGDGRADYVSINPDTAGVYMWENGCKKIDFPGDSLCKWDVDDANSWHLSGAADLVAKYIGDNGLKNWVDSANNKYYVNGSGSEDCWNLGSTGCTKPDRCSEDYNPIAWYYVRMMAAQVLAEFKNADHALTDNTIISLASIDDMIDDFKWEVPDDTSELTKVFGFLGSTAGLAAGVIGGGLGTAVGGIGGVFGLVGGAMTAAQGDPNDEATKSIDDAKVACGRYISSYLTNASAAIQDSLKGLFGGEPKDGDILENIYKSLVVSGLITESSQKDYVSKILDNGQFMVASPNSKMQDAMVRGFEDTRAGMLGHLLAGLHYMIIDCEQGSKEECDKADGARFVEDACIYMVYRPGNGQDSKDVSGDMVEKMEKKWNISFYDMLKNIKDCNNRQLSKDEQHAIFPPGGERYPPCFFGVAYLRTKNVNLPLQIGIHSDESPIQNLDKLPDWFGKNKEDWWNTPNCLKGGDCPSDD